MKSIGGRKMPGQSFFHLFMSVVLSLLFSSTSYAWQQQQQHCQSLRQRMIRSKQQHYGVLPTRRRSTTTNQSYSLPLSPLLSKSTSLSLSLCNEKVPNQTQMNMNMNSWFARKKNKYDKPQNVKGFRNNRFWRILLRTISIAPVLSMLVAATLFYPASAIAKTAPAAIAAPAVTAATAPIITCPISAATELRLMVRLVYAAFMGAVLGKERSAAKHSAGVRTMSLVSMGAAVFTVCSCYGFANFPRVDGKCCVTHDLLHSMLFGNIEFVSLTPNSFDFLFRFVFITIII